MSTLSPELTQQLIEQTVGCQLHCKKPSFTRSNSATEKQTAASQFGADGKAVGFSRVWMDRKHPAVKPILSVFNEAVTYWRQYTHDYPIDGIRLANTAIVDSLNNRITALKGQLVTLCAEADEQLPQIKAERQQKLGSLYRESDFFDSFADVFKLWVSWPDLRPDERLMQLNPQIYAQAQAKVQQQFEQALAGAQEALADEFTNLVTNLSDTLNGRKDGEKKRFSESSVANLRNFLDRFQTLNVGGQPELEQLVEHAKALVSGQSAKAIKSDLSLENSIRHGLNEIRQAIPNVLEYKPDRELIIDEDEDFSVPPVEMTLPDDEPQPPGELATVASDNGLGLDELSL